MIRMTGLVLYAYVRGTASYGNVFAAHCSSTRFASAALLELSRCLINFVFHSRVKTLLYCTPPALVYCDTAALLYCVTVLTAHSLPARRYCRRRQRRKWFMRFSSPPPPSATARR